MSQATSSPTPTPSTQPPITILIADDQRLMRDGLRTLLELEDDLVVVGEADNGEERIGAL